MAPRLGSITSCWLTFDTRRTSHADQCPDTNAHKDSAGHIRLRWQIQPVRIDTGIIHEPHDREPTVAPGA
jgi:hypothetical protein